LIDRPGIVEDVVGGELDLLNLLNRETIPGKTLGPKIETAGCRGDLAQGI